MDEKERAFERNGLFHIEKRELQEPIYFTINKIYMMVSSHPICLSIDFTRTPDTATFPFLVFIIHYFSTLPYLAKYEC